MATVEIASVAKGVLGNDAALKSSGLLTLTPTLAQFSEISFKDVLIVTPLGIDLRPL